MKLSLSHLAACLPAIAAVASAKGESATLRGAAAADPIAADARRLAYAPSADCDLACLWSQVAVEATLMQAMIAADATARQCAAACDEVPAGDVDWARCRRMCGQLATAEDTELWTTTTTTTTRGGAGAAGTRYFSKKGRAYPGPKSKGFKERYYGPKSKGDKGDMHAFGNYNYSKGAKERAGDNGESMTSRESDAPRWRDDKYDYAYNYGDEYNYEYTYDKEYDYDNDYEYAYNYYEGAPWMTRTTTTTRGGPGGHTTRHYPGYKGKSNKRTYDGCCACSGENTRNFASKGKSIKGEEDVALLA